jgi:glycosyltransferase involved in cell wall biosynthesis
LIQYAEGSDAILVCYDTNAFEAFDLARRDHHLSLMLDMSSSHPAIREKLLAEERELHPEFADSILLPSEISPLHQRWLDEADMADWVLAASTFVKRGCEEQGVAEDRIFVVPYGVDTDLFKPDLDRPFRQRYRVLFAGGVSQRKGIKYLLETFCGLALPGAELHVCGGVIGSGRGLARYAEHFTHLTGKQHVDMPEVYRAADVFVLPSVEDGFGLVVLEAMACGLPVITTSNCGAADIIEDGVDGFVIPARDVDALGERLERLYRNRELRVEMGLAARRTAEKNDWARYQRDVEAVFVRIDKLMKGHTRVGARQCEAVAS